MFRANAVLMTGVRLNLLMVYLDIQLCFAQRIKRLVQ